MKDRKVNNLSRANSAFKTDELKDRIDYYEKGGIDSELENNTFDIKN